MQPKPTTYFCTSTNGFYDILTAAPVFQNLEDGPHNVNASEEDTITISCNAYAKPAATVTWWRNSILLNSE